MFNISVNGNFWFSSNDLGNALDRINKSGEWFTRGVEEDFRPGYGRVELDGNVLEIENVAANN